MIIKLFSWFVRSTWGPRKLEQEYNKLFQVMTMFGKTNLSQLRNKMKFNTRIGSRPIQRKLCCFYAPTIQRFVRSEYNNKANKN